MTRYKPYSFSGDWTDEEIALVKEVIDPHVPEAPDGSFNTWFFTKIPGRKFGARRATWDKWVLTPDTVQGLATRITNYYERRG